MALLDLVTFKTIKSNVIEMPEWLYVDIQLFDPIPDGECIFTRRPKVKPMCFFICESILITDILLKF